METPATLVGTPGSGFVTPATLVANTPRRGIPLESRFNTIESVLTAVDEAHYQEQHAKDLEKGLWKAIQQSGTPAVREKVDKDPEPEIDCSWIVLISCTIIVSITQGCIAFVAAVAGSAFGDRVRHLYTTQRASSITWIDVSQVRDRRFWLLGLSIMFTAFAMLPPFAFLTIYTRQLVPGISPQMSVVPLALVNLTAVFGRSITALLIRPFAPGLSKQVSAEDGDNHYRWRLAVEPRRAFAGVILLAALSQLIWAFARSYSQILAYSCIHGLFGATFLSILPTLSAITFSEVDKATATGCLVIFATPGCFFGAYVFNTLMHRTGSWTICLLTLSTFQAIGAIFAFFVNPGKLVSPFPTLTPPPPANASGP
ncbi:hypothetical protein FRC00_002596 [Tulasnella sp. 408]|nr:hypothetical protein FRC00_002596 [Tulasnella sp. 408]